MDGDLYERDFYLWTRAQAEALRERERGANQLDYDRLAEEVEDLGLEQRNAVTRFIIRTIQHLYKLSASKQIDPREHRWTLEQILREGDDPSAD